jgi:transposase
MIVLGQLAQSEDQGIRAAASTASQYYFGRIDGRVADAQLEETIWRETRGLPPDQREQIVQACADHMRERGQRLVEVGNRIGAREGQPVRQ